MNADDRIMMARCFLFSMKILFALLYAATDRINENLFADYKNLADDLKKWYSPGGDSDDPDPSTSSGHSAASIRARSSAVCGP